MFLSVRSVALALILLVLSAAAAVAADTDTEKLQRELISPWIVTVQGEARARSLHIRGAERKSNDVWTLDATYDWLYSEKPPSVKAELTVSPNGYKLELVTRANSLIVAESSDLTVFSGTFRPTSGAAKQVTVEKVSAEELSKRRQAAFAQLFVQPGPAIPATCAGFVGVWTGNWPGYGPTWLWVVEVDADCVAKCTNRSSSAVPDSFQACGIKGSVLARPKPEGMEYYELRGDELWARFAPTIGPTNSTVFRRYRPGEN